jgi:hypothetical protein
MQTTRASERARNQATMATSYRRSKHRASSSSSSSSSTLRMTKLFIARGIVVTGLIFLATQTQMVERTSRGSFVVSAYSSGAGTCEYAGVLHGIPSSSQQLQTGEYSLQIGQPGINVPGSVVALKIAGKRAYKGFLVYAVDGITGVPIGKFRESEMPERSQVHAQCEYAATHDVAHHKSTPNAEFADVLPWVVPVVVPKKVTFKVTVVEEYEYWFAFEQTYEFGSARAGGVEGVEYIQADKRKSDKDGNKAPSLGAAMRGGYQPKVSENDDDDDDDDEDKNGNNNNNNNNNNDNSVNRRSEDPDGVQFRAKTKISKEKHQTYTSKLAKGGENKNIYIPDPRNKAKKASERVSEEQKQAQRKTMGRVAHGLIMFIVWIFLAPASASIARYGKASASGWFEVHKGLSTIILYATIGAIFGILYLRGFSTPWGPHGTYGLKTIALCCIQMSLGNVRKWIPRPIFRVIHRFLGVLTLLVSWYTVRLGSRLIANIESGVAKNVPFVAHASMFLVLSFVYVMQRNHSNVQIETKTSRYSV